MKGENSQTPKVCMYACVCGVSFQAVKFALFQSRALEKEEKISLVSPLILGVTARHFSLRMLSTFPSWMRTDVVVAAVVVVPGRRD